MKRCTRCEVKYEGEDFRDNFYKKTGRKDGLDNLCKTCRKEENRSIYVAKKGGNVRSIPEKECRCCKKSLPITTYYWHVRKKNPDGYDSMCKVCKNKRKREAKAFRLKTQAVEIKAKEIKKLNLENEAMNTMYAEILSRRIELPGLKISELNLELGQAYKIKIPVRSDSEKTHHYFIGKLIQICDRHLVFKNKNGRCESFLKVDLLLEHEYKEVN